MATVTAEARHRLRPGDIRLDDATQPRAAMKEATIAEYEEAMRGGDKFPPPTVFHDGEVYWLADGFHRVEAAIRAGLKRIECEVRGGSKRDAILFSVGANATRGERRTNADKRRAVTTLLDDPEWRELPAREIARRCGVTHTFVGEIKWEREGRPRDPATKRRSDDPETAVKIQACESHGGNGYHPVNVADDLSDPDFDEPAAVQSLDEPTVQPAHKESTPLIFPQPSGVPVVPGTPVTPDPAHADDPPDVAAGRRNGTIPADVKVEVTEPQWEECVTEGTDGPVEPPAEPTDEEYLAACPARAKLPEHCRERFDAEALAWRASRAIRDAFGEQMRPLLKKLDRHLKTLDLEKFGHHRPGNLSPWRWRMRMFLEMNDPTRWMICPDCDGSGAGVIGMIPRCPTCHGEGFKVG